MKINNSVIGLWCFRMIFVLCLVSAGMNGYAAEQPNLKFDGATSFQDNVAVVKVNGKCGLIDVDGHFLVPAKYDDIGTDSLSWYQGTTIVKNANRYGLISIAGKEIIPVKYEAMWPYHGLIGVKQGGKWGVCDRTGREIVPISYEGCSIDSDDTLKITISLVNLSAIMGESDHKVVPGTPKYDCIEVEEAPRKNFSRVEKDHKWGVLDDGGKELIPPIYDRVTMGDKLIFVQKDDKVGFMNYQGQVAIPLQYGIYTRYFSEGLALAEQKLSPATVVDQSSGGVVLVTNPKGKCGYIDENNKTVIPFVYDGGTPFEDGLAIVERNHKTGVINKDNTIIIPLQYDGVWFIGNGLFSVCIGNGTNNQHGVIDKTNKVVIPISKDAPSFHPFPPDIQKIYHDYVNSKIYLKIGDKLIPTTYDDVDPFTNGMASVEVNHKWGYIDETGKLIIPATYDEAESFGDGLAPVKVQDKWGYIDTTGQLIIPATYDNAGPFVNGRALVVVNHKCGYINKQGQLMAWSCQ